MGCSTTKKIETTKFEHFPPDAANWPINSSIFAEKDPKVIDDYLIRIEKEQAAVNTKWWTDYRRAQLWEAKNKKISCENYAHLASDARFPLRRLAFLKAHEVCPNKHESLNKLEAFDENSFDPWLSRKALDVAISKARMAKDRPALVELLTRKSKLNLRKSLKVELSEEALKWAKRTKDKKRIKELQQRIYSLSPSLNPNVSWRDYLNVANDYRYNNNYTQARKYFRKAIAHKNISSQEKISAFRSIRSTYRVDLDADSALRTTEELVSFVEKERKKRKSKFTDSQLLDSYLFLARSYWTENQRSLAEKTLARAEKKLKNKISLSEVFWIRGRMEEERQNFTKAVALYDQALAEKGTAANFLERVRWYKAWSLRKLNKHEIAAAELKTLREKTESDYDRARYSYWYARTLSQLGDTKEAAVILKELIKSDSLNYYSFLAHRELGEPLPAKTIDRDVANLTGKDVTVPRDLRNIINTGYMEWLIALKETEISEDYLSQISKDYKNSKSKDVDSLQVLLEYYARSGNYQTLFSQLYSYDSETRKAIIDNRIDLLYPRPYPEYVADAALRFGISSEFIYSIMRQESSFNPQARSHMDAFGLMQILPKVAEAAAQQIAVAYQTPEDLYEPSINIPLGSSHLRELWDRYNGDLVLAAASYNASEKAIQGWLKTRYRGDTVEFIEDIPYDETRDYVKLVLRNMLAYRSLNAQSDFIDFPEWTLKISAADSD
jgi:soluble lytic murein transglycosylase